MLQKIILKSKRDGSVIFEKSLSRITKIEIDNRDVVIRFPNGLSQMYFKSMVHVVIEGGAEVKEERTCPICERVYTEHPAISRRDNKTEICPECGMTEAFSDYYGWRLRKNDRIQTK